MWDQPKLAHAFRAKVCARLYGCLDGAPSPCIQTAQPPSRTRGCRVFKGAPGFVSFDDFQRVCVLSRLKARGARGAATRGRRGTGKGLGRGDNSAPPGRRLLERQWRLGASFVYIDQHRVTSFYGELTQAGSRSQLRINYFKKIKTNSHCTQTEEINISSCTSTLYCPSSNRNIYYYLFYASRISPNRLPHFSLH